MALFLCRSFCVPREGVACIVDYDVKVEVLAKMLCGRGEGGVHGTGRCDIQSEFEDVWVGVREVGEA